ncbi:MAG TPA: hypothetical protein PLC98_10085 [Anaerolineales bacterium]|nr:hypothetical protein [Anaerolineales bacterium]
MNQADPDHRPGWLARGGITLIASGLLLFVLGLWPELFGADFTPEIGVLQIFAFLLGLTGMTLGAYIYLYATRHRAKPRKLREDIGVRLMATGLVVAATNGLADVIGIGSNFGEQRPLFGPVQAWGVALGVLIIFAGVALYAQRPK